MQLSEWVLHKYNIDKYLQILSEIISGKKKLNFFMYISHALSKIILGKKPQLTSIKNWF